MIKRLRLYLIRLLLKKEERLQLIEHLLTDDEKVVLALACFDAKQLWERSAVTGPSSEYDNRKEDVRTMNRFKDIFDTDIFKP